MDFVSGLADGFSVVLSLQCVLSIIVGVVIGQIVGALPGVGGSAGMALLLPVTFGMPPIPALMLIAGIMYGSQYGNSLSAVLLNVPGDSSSVMTALEGNMLARKGQAGKALSIAAVSSFIAGVAATLALAIATPILSKFALKFSAPEYFLLAALGITATASLGGGSAGKAFLAAAFGSLIALIGVDPISGETRLTLGISNLLDGIEFLPVAIGIFGVAEILVSLESQMKPVVMPAKLRDLWPRWKDFVDVRWSIFRGWMVGFLIGVMPGTGPTVATFLTYAVERRFARQPEMLGKGSTEALSSVEASNNSAATGALIPMLTLGIPGSASTAVLLAAFILLGIRPGPLLMVQQYDLVWGLIASMFVGNVILLVLNLPLAPLFASLLKIPYTYLASGILIMSMVGAFATTMNMFTVGIMLFFGGVGYILIKAGIPRAPIILALVLTPIMETSLRQALTMSRGSLSIFVSRPLAAALLLVVLATLILPLANMWLLRRRHAATAA
ncbi:putative tricarboxylic transport membrane protein [Pseudorhizobium tarimense]|uniref:Tricarboxylic transport membrane protein n=1 Tax=Pseudorhizobium tarimense TaxID=1079109 RepID=A0ABV2HCY0_9HYPH|nr:tripartite tricarboxylate transporter permease [Pseudorhizobium tarimense]MCJ8521434.1 tripartite tricarboxylate transporter permease [Pseudorhizobium tarimense]